MNNYIEIKGIIDEYIILMDKLIEFEQQKLEAIKEKNTVLLDTFLKEEQVYLLQLRGLDQKRETIQKHLGLEGLTYRQIIDKTEDSTRNKFESSYELLSTKTTQFKELINTIKTYIDIRLHTIGSILEKFEGSNISTNSSTSLSDMNKSGIYEKIASEANKPQVSHSKFESTKV